MAADESTYERPSIEQTTVRIDHFAPLWRSAQCHIMIEVRESIAQLLTPTIDTSYHLSVER